MATQYGRGKQNNPAATSLRSNKGNLFLKQECIPVGCVPAERWPYSGGEPPPENLEDPPKKDPSPPQKFGGTPPKRHPPRKFGGTPKKDTPPKKTPPQKRHPPEIWRNPPKNTPLKIRAKSGAPPQN